MPVPLLTLNNGLQLPAIGFGVFQTPPDETIAAAIDAAAPTIMAGNLAKAGFSALIVAPPCS